MDPNNLVLDISSDEESDGKDRQVNLEWFCDQLFKDADDSDDVVVVGEVLSSKKVEDNCLRNSVAVGNFDEKKKQEEEEDDDDCVVLDGDPDKMVSVEENQDDGSDELVVVGEKGQVACRDYPHPRHLCVKYPFSSTLHKFHCEQCHCYVCDTIAPCNLWGTGMTITDHCHATDKQEVWKTERKNFKLKRCSSLPALKMSENPSSLVPSAVSNLLANEPHLLTRSITMPNHHFPLRSMPSVPTVPSVPAVRSVLSPPEFRPIPLPSASMVRPVPSAPNLQVPSTINPMSGSYRFPQSSGLQQSNGGYAKFVDQRARYHNAVGLGPQHVPFKRTRSSVTNRAAYQSEYGQPHTSVSSYAPSTTRNQSVSGESLNGDYQPHQWINVGNNMNTGTGHNLSSQSHYLNMARTAALYQDVTASRPSTMSTQNINQQVTYPTGITTPHSNVSLSWVDGTSSISTHWAQPLQAEFAPHGTASNIWADKTSANSGQLNHNQQTEVSTPNTSAPWVDNSNSSRSDQHLQSDALGVQGQQPINAAPDYTNDEHSIKGASVTRGSDDQASAVPELENLHFEFEDWLMDNQPAVGSSIEPPFFANQNILSPDDAHIDSVLLYDDEWSVLANGADI